MKKELVIAPKPPKGEDGHRVFSIRIREELCGKLDELASQTGRSRNELIGILLEYAIDNSTVSPKESE